MLVPHLPPALTSHEPQVTGEHGFVDWNILPAHLGPSTQGNIFQVELHVQCMK